MRRRPASELIKKGLRIAEEAQQRMLPQEPPAIDGFSVDFRCVPAREVGGDLYEYIELPDGRWGIALGDFSGHGLEAAIQMNFVKGHLLATATALADPAKVLCEITADFVEYRSSKKDFVAMVYGILDPRSRMFEFARAGDIHLLWRRPRRSKKFVAVTGRSFLMGSPVSAERFERGLVIGSVQLDVGDVLLLYTDGIPDAMNPDRDHFDDARLRQAVAETDGLQARATLEAVLTAVERFIGKERRAHDDMTLIVVRADD